MYKCYNGTIYLDIYIVFIGQLDRLAYIYWVYYK